MTEQMPGSHDLAEASQPRLPAKPDEAREIFPVSWDTNVQRSEKDFRPLPTESDEPVKTPEQLVEEEIVDPKDLSAVEPADSSDAAEEMEALSLEQSEKTASKPAAKVSTPGKAPVVGSQTS